MKKFIYIIVLFGCLRIEGAASSAKADLHLINNTREPLFIRVRRGDGSAKPTDNTQIFKLSKDKSFQVLYNLEKDDPLRVRIFPKEFDTKVNVPDLENYAYGGLLLKPGQANIVVIAKQAAAIGLAEALEKKSYYSRPTIINLKNGPKITSSEPVSAILLAVKNVETFKKELSQLMATWSSIKLDSEYETEQTIMDNGTAFRPIKTTGSIRKIGQENFGPQLDIRSLEELEESEVK